METRLIGPKAASDVGRLKMPTPMMLPMMSATAAPRPKLGRAEPPGSAATSGGRVVTDMTDLRPGRAGCAGRGGRALLGEAHRHLEPDEPVDDVERRAEQVEEAEGEVRSG